jgi:hypothetical protein
MNNTLILVICALSVEGFSLRRDSKHKNCAIGEQGGKNLKFVSRNNYQFGEEEKEQYNKFKKESRELVITIENTYTSNNTQTIVPSEVTVNEKKEQMKEKDKKKKEKKDNKENKNSARAERKRKHSPARSTGRSIIPVPESRLIIIKPKKQNSCSSE